MMALQCETGRSPALEQFWTRVMLYEAVPVPAAQSPQPLALYLFRQNYLLWAFHRNRIACGLVSLTYATPQIFSGSIVQYFTPLWMNDATELLGA